MNTTIRRTPNLGILIFFALFLLQLCAGCTFMENLRRGQASEGPSPEMVAAGESVERRTAELTGLEGTAGGISIGNLARAQFVLEEMVYFKEKGDPGEVKRLDGVIEQVLDSIRAAIEAGGEPAPDRIARLEEQNRALQSKVENLESSANGLAEDLFAQKTFSEIQIESLARRLNTAEKARDDAIREVVRTRSRIEGMASQAEASAMFAEARVLVDRMNEEAFNDRALGDLELARGYLASGKKELEGGNSGGAAYLFDLVSSVYEGFKTSNPGKVTIGVKQAVLYKSPSGSSAVVGSLQRGETATGFDIRKGWIQVRLPSGIAGWVRKTQVH